VDFLGCDERVGGGRVLDPPPTGVFALLGGFDDAKVAVSGLA
jgi:hypothetical protein